MAEKAIGLATFTLLNGGSSFDAYESFWNSRLCLHDAVPALLKYEDVAFHSGNVPTHIQQNLQQLL